LPRDENIRANWNKQFTKHGIRCLQERIIELDPVFAKTAELDNPQRLIRAIEVCETTGAKLSELRNGNSKIRPFQCHSFYLNPERATLYERINQRVDTMLNTGLLDEVKSHVMYKGSNALKTVGYSELFSFLDGEYSFEYTVLKIKQHTRNYAKRQVTWFKKQDGFIPVADNAVSFIQKHLNA
jgi:tRNA dimethylallyltransferase